MKSLHLVLLTLLMLIISSAAWCSSYQYMTAADLKQKIEAPTPVQLIDIQVRKDFDEHHITGALPTYAYPVKSIHDRQKLATALPILAASKAEVVIVCPRGGGGAKRAYDYLRDQGIELRRLFILEKGQQGWPFKELLTKSL